MASSAQPKWHGGVPYCSLEDCRRYDGKRCDAQGMRPQNICEPVVQRLAQLALSRGAVTRTECEDI